MGMIGGYSGLPTSRQLADIEEASADLRKGRRGDQSAICPQPRFHCRADTPELVVNGMVQLRHLLTEKFGIPWLARRHKAFVLYGKFDFFVEEKQGLVSRENRACLVSKRVSPCLRTISIDHRKHGTFKAQNRGKAQT